ncbi:hypothetical protein F5B21DRAFT_496970 [Xylaria acuta]|nr:hypothetical protein F5B21DRAFT_496970 [Xylaria acuta]
MSSRPALILARNRGYALNTRCCTEDPKTARNRFVGETGLYAKCSVFCSIMARIISANNPLPHISIQQIATTGPLIEISNTAGAVRRYIFWNGLRDPLAGKI